MSATLAAVWGSKVRHAKKVFVNSVAGLPSGGFARRDLNDYTDVLAADGVDGVPVRHAPKLVRFVRNIARLQISVLFKSLVSLEGRTDMKAVLFLMVALAAPGLALTADLPAALKPQAEQFNKSWEGLKTAANSQLVPARDRYIAALTATQKSAEAAAKTTDLAAITNELDGVRAGSLPLEAPPDLPRALGAERRSYVSTAATLAKTTAQRQRDLATKYLQTLVTMEASASKAKDVSLGEAVAVEKQRVLGLLEASGGGAKHRNIVTNGDFSDGQDGSAPPGWKKETEVTVSDATIVTEGGNKFLRFRRIPALRRANLVPEKEIPVPADARAAEFSVRMRVKGLVPGKDWGVLPSINVSGRGARGEEVSKEAVALKEDSGWRRFTGRVQLPATAKTLKVTIGPNGAAGIVDFDDVEVEFR